MHEHRDPAFWNAVAAHPQVAHVLMGLPAELGAVVAHPRVTPLAAAHGGFLFVALDGIGRVHELHTLFTPEGWGREVHRAAKEAFAEMFGRGAQVIVTYEVEGWARPPRSFGWRPAGPFAPSSIGQARSWVLSRDAWEASPARGRAARKS